MSASIKMPRPVVALNGNHSYQGSPVHDGSKQQWTSGLCVWPWGWSVEWIL